VIKAIFIVTFFDLFYAIALGCKTKEPLKKAAL